MGIKQKFEETKNKELNLIKLINNLIKLNL